MATLEAVALTGNTSVNERLVKPEEPIPVLKERTGCCAPCEWFKEKPLSRFQFALFLLFAPLTIVWIIMRIESPLTADIMAGLCGVVLSLYGARHFRILLGLKEEVNRLADNNQEFKHENASLELQVNKLNKAQDELIAVQSRLQDTTKQHAESIKKFKALDIKLSELSGDSIEGLEKLQKMSHMVANSLKDELIQHERSILMKAMEAMEFGDGKEGLDENEYHKFIGLLPGSFQRRFSAMDKSFQEIAGDDDVLCMDDFTQLADQFALEEAHAGGTRL